MKNSSVLMLLLMLYAIDTNRHAIAWGAMILLAMDTVILIVGLIKIALGKQIES